MNGNTISNLPLRRLGILKKLEDLQIENESLKIQIAQLNDWNKTLEMFLERLEQQVYEIERRLERLEAEKGEGK